MKATLDLYGQFLLSSQINYTCTYLADHFADLMHDNVQYFQRTSHLEPRMVWKRARTDIVLSPRGYLLYDDTVLNRDATIR